MRKLLVAALIAMSAPLAAGSVAEAATTKIVIKDNGKARVHHRVVERRHGRDCMTKKVVTRRHGERIVRTTKVCR